MTESGAKHKDFSMKIYSMSMNKEIRLMKNVGRMARCSVCNKSQFERRKPCIDGEKDHNFVRTGIVGYEEELKMIWKARQQ
jgi:hypothetical protein